MSESPLYQLSSALMSLVDGLTLSPIAWLLIITAVLAFFFHRTAWLTLIWLLLLVRLTQGNLDSPFAQVAVWLGWLLALWRPDTPLRLARAWLPLALLSLMALWPWLPVLPPTWQAVPAWTGLEPLAAVALSPLVLTLAFVSALSILFRFFLYPSSSWPWQGLGLALTAWLSWQGQSDALVWMGLGLALGALILTDAYSVAYRDALTGIPNRRSLTQAMRTLGRRYAIAMADVDHFKAFNDTWGHETGDQVLKLVARILTRHKLPVRVYRYGGEEFTLVFRGMTRQQAAPVLNELRERIAAYPLAVRNSGRPKSSKEGRKQRGRNGALKEVTITASFGVTDAASASTPEEAIQIADKALYKAKEAGRNCVKGL